MAADVSPARRCAYAVLRRTFEQGAHTDRALRAEASRAGLEGRDLALATQLAYGSVQRRGTLDHVIAALAERPVERLDGATLAALRLGLFQLLFLGRVPEHAAVHEAVELAKDGHHGGHALVNAVLRRATREAAALLDALDDTTPAGAAVKHSHPEWVASMWFELLGPDDARALLARNNTPAESAIRANTLVTTARQLAGRLRVRTHLAERLPEGLVVEEPFDAFGSSEWEAGALMPQSRASMLVGHVLAPRPGERVLDLCAAPGAKTTHLAALMRGEGELVAIERHRGRAQALERTCLRTRAANARVLVADARDGGAGEGFDRVLVDPPCSGLGTLQARPDRRWRAEESAIDELAETQAAILSAGAAALIPGGVLVYSTCTISPRENERQIDAFLRAHVQFEADDLSSDYPLWKHPTVDRHLQTLPHRDATDGFFIARLRRSAA